MAPNEWGVLKSRDSTGHSLTQLKFRMDDGSLRLCSDQFDSLKTLAPGDRVNVTSLYRDPL